jgi:hypothetical protein
MADLTNCRTCGYPYKYWHKNIINFWGNNT